MPLATGYLILYFSGVVKVLQQLGIVGPDNNSTRAAGTSSGALTSAAICSGTDADAFYQSVREAMV